MELNEFIFGSREASDVTELFALFGRVVEPYGYDQRLFAIISDHPQLNDQHDLGLVETTSVDHWINHYHENNYLSLDYVHQCCHRAPGLFRWQDLARTQALSKVQRQILHEAREAKLYEGLTVSTHGPDGVKSSLILAASQADTRRDQYVDDIIRIASYQFLHCFLALSNCKPELPGFVLTEREGEVLRWAASGLTKSEIGLKMNLSRHTVDYHIRNIASKTRSRNLAGALIVAIKEGAIQI